MVSVCFLGLVSVCFLGLVSVYFLGVVSVGAGRVQTRIGEGKGHQI